MAWLQKTFTWFLILISTAQGPKEVMLRSGKSGFITMVKLNNTTNQIFHLFFLSKLFFLSINAYMLNTLYKQIM